MLPTKLNFLTATSLVATLATPLLILNPLGLHNQAVANTSTSSGDISGESELIISQARECQEDCPPVITKFYCEGQEDSNICESTYEDPGNLIIEYEDPDGDASLWFVSGYTFAKSTKEGEIDPPNGNSSLKVGLVCICESSACTSESSFTMQATLIDATGKRGYASLPVHCKPGIDDLIEGEIRERVPIPDEIPNIPLPW
ncbi:MAG: hypothetical protein F6J92_07245 [Symploca sp. SIO1A3]|nr:hypothetical protein [Symploca sp. SIO1A3]